MTDYICANQGAGTGEYDLWLLHHANGSIIAHIGTYYALQYTKVVNEVGAWTLTLPEEFDMSLVQRDTRLVVYRKPPGGTKALEFVGLVRYKERAVRGQSSYNAIAGEDLNSLLKRRIIAYGPSQPESEKTNFADDMMKEYVYENMGAGSVAGRNLSADGFTIQADVGAGTTVYSTAQWLNLLDVLKKISDASQTDYATGLPSPTTSVYFGIVPLNTGWDCEFRTNVQQWGLDHRFPGGPDGPVIFSLAFRNLTDVTRNINYRDEITYGYGGTEGDADSRTIITFQDDSRAGQSPFNRCEIFVDGRGNEVETIYEIYYAVRAGRPRRLFSAGVAQIGNYVYGRDYSHGDYVTCVYDGETFDARIDAVTVSVSESNEDVQLQLREETYE